MLQLESQLRLRTDPIINTGNDITTAKKEEIAETRLTDRLKKEPKKKTNECCNVLFMEMVAYMVSAPFKTNRSSKTTCHHLQWTPTISASLVKLNTSLCLSPSKDR